MYTLERNAETALRRPETRHRVSIAAAAVKLLDKTVWGHDWIQRRVRQLVTRCEPNHQRRWASGCKWL